MNRTIRKTASTLALLAAAAAQAQRDFSNVEIIPHHVAGNMYYLQGAGGNIGLSIGEDGVVMIDDQFAPLTERIVAAIGELDDGATSASSSIPMFTATIPAATATSPAWGSTF